MGTKKIKLNFVLQQIFTKHLHSTLRTSKNKDKQSKHLETIHEHQNEQ